MNHLLSVIEEYKRINKCFPGNNGLWNEMFEKAYNADKESNSARSDSYSEVASQTDLLAENKLLRELLWLRHGCHISALYGDDGEMSCGKCLLDFKRMSAEKIRDMFEPKQAEIREAIKQHLENNSKQTL